MGVPVRSETESCSVNSKGFTKGSMKQFTSSQGYGSNSHIQVAQGTVRVGTIVCSPQ